MSFLKAIKSYFQSHVIKEAKGLFNKHMKCPRVKDPLNTTFIFTCSCYGIGQRVRVTYCNILRVQVMSKTWAASEKKCLKTCFF